MNNTIFYLIGDTAAARLAVAQEVAALTGAKVVDSQATYAPIFNLLESQQPADVPEAAWAEVDVVRGAILRTIETQSPRHWSFIFTHAGLDIAADVGVYHTVRETARRRGAAFVPVTLTGTKPKSLLAFDEPEAIVVDTTAVSPRDAAMRIVASAQ